MLNGHHSTTPLVLHETGIDFVVATEFQINSMFSQQSAEQLSYISLPFGLPHLQTRAVNAASIPYVPI